MIRLTMRRTIPANRWLAWVMLAAGMLVVGAHRAHADTVVSDHWYLIELDGQRAGWMHARVEQRDREYHNHTEMSLRMGRGGDGTSMRTRSMFIETMDGRPVRLEHEQVMSRQAVTNTFEFDDTRVLHTARQGEREIVRELELPSGNWLTPMAAQRFFEQRREAGAREISYRTISPEHGMEPVQIRHRLVGEDRFEHDGRELPVTVWTTRTSVLPLDMTEHYTADGQLIFQKVRVGMGVLTMRLATQAQALEKVDGPAPEMMIQSFIRPDRRISRVERATTARYRLRLKAGEMPDIPSAGAQRVSTIADSDELLVTVDVRDPLPAPDEARQNPAHLESSAMVDASDPLVIKLAEQAVRRVRGGDRNGATDAAARAEAMRRFVYQYVTNKSLDLAFATASETARMREGDCTEHAVLLCAMLRAQEIPARVASGLVYADGFAGERHIFGWHMWTQALIDGRWIDLDATQPGSFHAGHILTGTSTLAGAAGDAGGADLSSMIVLMGNLEIAVEEIGYDR